MEKNEQRSKTALLAKPAFWELLRWVRQKVAQAQKLGKLVGKHITHRGGGLIGIIRTAAQSVMLLVTLGPAGFRQRYQLFTAVSGVENAPSMPRGDVDIRMDLTEEDASDMDIHPDLGIMVHIFYMDLLDEFAGYLSNIPWPFTLLVSVVTPEAAAVVRSRFTTIPRVRRCIIKVVPNRGRDIAPLLVAFREEIRALEYIGHIHTKKSLFTGSEQKDWRRYLLDELLGSRRRVTAIFDYFNRHPKVGLIYPETFESIPCWCHTWLQNKPIATELAKRLNIEIDLKGYVDFPAGSMFWARSAALEPLFSLNLNVTDFPEEMGQIDGALQHAIERFFALAAAAVGFEFRVMRSHRHLEFICPGDKNWVLMKLLNLQIIAFGRAVYRSLPLSISQKNRLRNLVYRWGGVFFKRLVNY